MSTDALSIAITDSPAEARSSSQAAGGLTISRQSDLSPIPEVQEPEEILKIRFVLAHMKEIPGTKAGDVFFLRPTEKRVLTYFSYRWVLFLKELSKASFVEACGTFNIELERGMRFLSRKDIAEWFEDRFKKLIQSESYDPLAWKIQALNNFETDSMSMVQYKQWENFGDRFEPKPSRNGDNNPSKIEININPLMVEKAFSRQKAIDAKVVKE